MLNVPYASSTPSPSVEVMKSKTAGTGSSSSTRYVSSASARISFRSPCPVTCEA